MKLKCIVIFLLIIAHFSFAQDFSADGKCIDGPLNIRSAPSIQSGKLGMLIKDDEFMFITKIGHKEVHEDKSDHWYKIETKSGIQGYVFGAYIKFYNEELRTFIYDDGDVLKPLFASSSYYLDSLKLYSDKNLQNSYVKRSGDFYFIKIYTIKDNKVFLISKENGEYGWIEAQSISIPEEIYYKEVKDGKKLDNVYKNAKYTEYQLNKAEDDRIIRNGPVLKYDNSYFYDHIDRTISIIKKDNHFIKHKYNSTNTYHFNLVDTLGPKQILLIQSHYEGSAYNIFNTAKNTSTGYILSLPQFNEDRSMFISLGTFYGEGPQTVDIFELKDNEYVNVLHTSIDFFEYYTVKRIDWKDREITIIHSEGEFLFHFQKGEWMYVKNEPTEVILR